MKFFVFLLFISSICFGQENNDSISVSNLMENDPLLKMLKGKSFMFFLHGIIQEIRFQAKKRRVRLCLSIFGLRPVRPASLSLVL